jgi:hypothetical protein
MFKLEEKPAFGPHSTRIAMPMKTRAKIRPASIEDAHRTLDALPEHRPDEFTKTQAVQRLAVPIRAAQAKGYSLAAIGKVLSDCGIPITAGALRAYVSGVDASADRKGKRKSKRAAKSPKEPQRAALRSNQKAAPMQPSGSAAKASIAGPTRTVDLDWDADARSDKSAPSPADAPRTGFYVRPDTRDI